MQQSVSKIQRNVEKCIQMKDIREDSSQSTKIRSWENDIFKNVDHIHKSKT